MEFKTTIGEIINSIKQREFLNEAEVTNGIILRILNQLNWNIYDTKKVKPQYRIDNKMIDFALCFPENKPIIIIEVKALGKAVNTDEQVLTYAFKTGIPMAILTDGQEWHFYLPAERGSLSERRFYKLDLLERSEDEIIDILEDYLKYDTVKSGEAIKKAKSHYDKQYKNNEINASIPKAWQKLIKDRDGILINLLSEKVADLCGFEPSEDVILTFLNDLQKSGNQDISNSTNSFVTNVGSATVTILQPSVPSSFKGLIYNGQKFEIKKAISVLIKLLEIVIKDFPNALSKIEVRTTTKKRALISKNKLNLYLTSTDLVETSSQQLSKGWWLGKNLSSGQIQKSCRTIIDCVTDEYGSCNILYSL